MGLFPSCNEQGLLFVAVCRLLAVASLVAAHGLHSRSSWALEYRLNNCGAQA